MTISKLERRLWERRLRAAILYTAILSTITIAIPRPAAADEDTIVVTASRTQLALEDALAPVIVITGEELARSATFDVLEAIRLHAGLDIGRNGGPGQTASLFIRGGNSNHTLVMIDGVRINPGTLGAAALQNIPPDGIERIEIVKGPRSTLYGSDAIGGVVNIITRRAQDGIEGGIQVGGGSFGTRKLAAGLRAGDEGRYAGLHVSRLDTDGFPTLAGSELDRGHDNTTVGAHLGVREDRWSLELRHWSTGGTTEYLDFLGEPLDQDYRNHASAVEIGLQHADAWRSRLLVSRVQDEIVQNQSPDFADTVRRQFDWQHDVTLDASNSVQFGIARALEQVHSEVFGAGFVEAPAATALYGQALNTTGPFRTQVAVRHTEHDAFGDHVTWNVEFGFELGTDWRLVAGAGNAFRAPSSTERFGSGGNPDLDAETSRNAELGLRGRIGEGQRVQVQLFDNRIRDLITFDMGTFTLENVERARNRGVELAHTLQRGDWSLRNTLVVQRPENRTTGELLPRRARRSLGSRVTWQARESLSLGAGLLAVSARKDSAFSDEVNAGYLLAGLSADWRPAPQWSLGLRVENLFDTDYETAHGFNSPGRSAFLQLGWNH